MENENANANRLKPSSSALLSKPSVDLSRKWRKWPANKTGGSAPILGAFPGILPGVPGKFVRQDAEPCMLEARAPWKRIALGLDSTKAAERGSRLNRK